MNILTLFTSKNKSYGNLNIGWPMVIGQDSEVVNKELHSKNGPKIAIFKVILLSNFAGLSICRFKIYLFWK